MARSPRSPRSPRRRRWLRARVRRVIAAGLVAIAAWLALSALLPAPAPVGVPVLVAARDLPVGHELGADDLRVQLRPAADQPESIIGELAAATGRALAAPLAEGEELTTTRLRGPAQLRAMPAGTVAVSVPVAEPGILALLAAGDRVAVLAVGTGARVAEGVVLTVETTVGTGAFAGGSDRLTVAMGAESARALAAASAPGGLGGGFVVALLGS